MEIPRINASDTVRLLALESFWQAYAREISWREISAGKGEVPRKPPAPP